MHTKTTARTEPYLWVTWMTKLLAGESSCVWSAWLRAHHQTAKRATDFDLGSWQMEHTALLRRTLSEYEEKGYSITTEGQNQFALRGQAGTLAGKPDLVAIKDAAGWVIDVKIGSPKASDRIQVMVYMWALRQTNPTFAKISLEGKVVYKAGYNIVTADEIDSDFTRSVVELIREVCGNDEPHRAPSFGECKFCPVTPEDCADRVDTENAHEGETDEF